MRLLIAALWILVGGGIAGGVYWVFLITPVSTALALIASAALALVCVALVGLIANGAIEIWLRGWSFAGVKRALRSIPAIAPAALIVLLVWWMTTRGELWVAQRNGQISAWFIARFGWDDISWLFTAIRYVATWLRWVLAAMLALSLMAGVLAVGWHALTQAAWLRRAVRPRGLLAATLWFAGLIALPWVYLVPWRPDNLPASSLELTFISVKLSLAAVLFAVGFALIAREAAAIPPTPGDPSEAAQAA